MKIGVIGCGNMAGAVVRGIHSHEKNVFFKTYTPSKIKALELAQDVSGECVDNLADLVDCDFLMVGCKPQQFTDLCEELKQFDLNEKIIISIMAALPIERVKKGLKVDKVIRLMPSMPMLYGEGISLLFASDEVSEFQYKQFSELLNGSSKVFEMKSEDEFDKLTVITASGPAYVYYFTEAFEQILSSWGIQEEIAKEMAIQLFKGSSVSMQNDKDSLKKQVAKVTSKKGVTIEAIEFFKENNISELINEGVLKALIRSDEMKSSL